MMHSLPSDVAYLWGTLTTSNAATPKYGTLHGQRESTYNKMEAINNNKINKMEKIKLNSVKMPQNQPTAHNSL